MGVQHLPEESAMSELVYRYQFADAVPVAEVEATLVLSVLAAESLHGAPQVRLDAGHFLDGAGRACVIDAGTAVGRDLNRLFTGFLSREFGPHAFRVEPIGA